MCSYYLGYAGFSASFLDFHINWSLHEGCCLVVYFLMMMLSSSFLKPTIKGFIPVYKSDWNLVKLPTYTLCCYYSWNFWKASEAFNSQNISTSSINSLLWSLFIRLWPCLNVSIKHIIVGIILCCSRVLI